jgi:hypothetical protein
MFPKLTIAVTIMAFIAVVTEAKIDLVATKGTTAKTLYADKLTNKEGFSVQKSPTFVTVSVYSSHDCSDSMPLSAFIYRTETCLTISDTSGIDAASTQYTWDSVDKILNEVYYSDSTCATSIGKGSDYSFASGACVDGKEYSTSSTFSFPGIGYAVK